MQDPYFLKQVSPFYFISHCFSAGELTSTFAWQVMESDKERVRSERDHLQTARAFSEAGNKVKELRAKLKSAINKSR